MVTIGMRAEALRKSKNWTQKELSDVSGYSTVIISRTENGNTISDSMANKYCEIFECEKKWLVNGEGEPPAGVVVQVTSNETEPWRDEAYKVLQKTNINLQAENQRLWLLIEKFTGVAVSKVGVEGNFNKAATGAGRQISLPFAAQTAA